MIDEYALMELAGRLKDPRQLERDYLLTFLLHEIYSQFATELVFKGGTALKYFYNLNRFSEDADFSYLPSGSVPDRKNLMNKMNAVFDSFGKQYAITNIEHRVSKAGDNVTGVNYVIRVKGPLNQKLGYLQNIKIDISTRNDMLSKPEIKYLSPVYPDITTFSLPVMDIEEILSEKLAAIIEREKMRDIYDAYFIMLIKGIKYDKKRVSKKMLLRNEKFKEEELLKKLDSAKDKMKWKSELAYIVNPLPDNLKIISDLKRIISE